MRGFRLEFPLTLVCVAALIACGGDDDEPEDPGVVNTGGKGGSGGAGAGAGAGGAGSGGAGAGGTAAPMCVVDDCPEATVQTDGAPCCTTAMDFMPYYTTRVPGVCGLKFPDRLPCFELDAPGETDDECPAMLDQGWGLHETCCHPLFKVCGIQNGDTGCTLFRPTAKRADGTEVGMGSGDFGCEPGPATKPAM